MAADRPTDFLACKACRPIWQRFRVMVAEANVAPTERIQVIGTYMDRVHRSDHDTDRVLADLEAEQRRADEARTEFRRAFMFLAMVGDLSKQPEVSDGR